MESFYWYRVELRINGRFYDWFVLKSDFDGYQYGDRIVKTYNGFTLWLKVTHRFDTEEQARGCIKRDCFASGRVFPMFLSEV